MMRLSGSIMHPDSASFSRRGFVIMTEKTAMPFCVCFEMMGPVIQSASLALDALLASKWAESNDDPIATLPLAKKAGLFQASALFL